MGIDCVNECRLETDHTESNKKFVGTRVRPFEPKISIRHKSWLDNSNLQINRSAPIVTFNLNVKIHCNVAASYEWYNTCFEISMLKLLKFSMKPDICLRGKDFHVDIDETKLGHRKYPRGKPLKDVWVFRGIRRKTQEVSSGVVLNHFRFRISHGFIPNFLCFLMK
ncbi:hypothetical protein RF11_08758 [Thelohanellus kitauei]|uniref:Uncharacterized protein n=1 Tax=Thelohanellus kitauei TaxID=669202 RepID=A0A0C2JPH9_THEKT|nr:hypothetical protein RF11_08758 [Thelohanellus kitauei]